MDEIDNANGCDSMANQVSVTDSNNSSIDLIPKYTVNIAEGTSGKYSQRTIKYSNGIMIIFGAFYNVTIPYTIEFSTPFVYTQVYPVVTRFGPKGIFTAPVVITACSNNSFTIDTFSGYIKDINTSSSIIYVQDLNLSGNYIVIGLWK